MGRTRKPRTEIELVTALEAAERRRREAERRIQSARKSEANAKKRLAELRASERSRRMGLLLDELGQLGFAMDIDDDIAAIVDKIKNAGTRNCDESELHVLHGLRDCLEAATKKQIRTAVELQQFIDVVQRPREMRTTKKPVALIRLIEQGYNVDYPAPAVETPDEKSEETG